MVETNSIPYLALFSHYVRTEYYKKLYNKYVHSMAYINNPNISIKRSAIVIKIEDVFLHSPEIAPYNLTMYKGAKYELYHDYTMKGISPIMPFMAILYEYLKYKDIKIIFVTNWSFERAAISLEYNKIKQYLIMKNNAATYFKLKKKYNILCSLNTHPTNVRDVIYPKLYY